MRIAISRKTSQIRNQLGIILPWCIQIIVNYIDHNSSPPFCQYYRGGGSVNQRKGMIKMDERPIGMTITEVSKALHIGVEQLRDYARTDPTFPCFSVGNKLITTEEAIREWATARAKMRVGMKTESSHVMEIVRRNRRERA